VIVPVVGSSARNISPVPDVEFVRVPKICLPLVVSVNVDHLGYRSNSVADLRNGDNLLRCQYIACFNDIALVAATTLFVWSLFAYADLIFGH
jgi:hypothetical protein